MDELSEQAQAALKLLDQETADAIIGSTDDEYGTLIRGTSAVVSLNWAVMKTHGLKQVPASLKAGAQTMTMILQLVHYAYALGMRRGLEEKPPPNLPLAGGGTEEGGG